MFEIILPRLLFGGWSGGCLAVWLFGGWFQGRWLERIGILYFVFCIVICKDARGTLVLKEAENGIKREEKRDKRILVAVKECNVDVHASRAAVGCQASAQNKLSSTPHDLLCSSFSLFPLGLQHTLSLSSQRQIPRFPLLPVAVICPKMFF